MEKVTHTNRIYGYLRASTEEQDADRARSMMEEFVKGYDREVDAWFSENISGATLQRPELFRLIGIAKWGDILLIEQVDRLSRLDEDDWEFLCGQLKHKGIKLVSLDLPISYSSLDSKKTDDFTSRIQTGICDMFIQFTAAFARKNLTDTKARQKQGIAKAKARTDKVMYKGRVPDHDKYKAIASLLKDNCSYSQIVDMLSVSRETISKVKKLFSN